MASANETIRTAIICFPTLFKTRADVLHHLFCVIGNGYTWHKGELVHSYPEDEQPWTAKNERESFARMGGPADLLKEITEKRVKENQAVVDNIDAVVQDLTFTRSIYPQSTTAFLFNIPADVTPDWAAAAEEAKTLAVQAGWKL